MTKTCSKCKESKPRSEFYKRSYSSDRLRSQCKDCHKAGAYATRNIDLARTATRHYMRRDRALNGEKHKERNRRLSKNRKKDQKFKARVIFNRYLKKNGIERPSSCPKCGRSDLRIEAHHEDYNRPLIIQWLCSVCHGEVHRKVA